MEENIYKDLEYGLCTLLTMCTCYILPIFGALGFGELKYTEAKVMFYITALILFYCLIKIHKIRKKYSTKQ